MAIHKRVKRCRHGNSSGDLCGASWLVIILAAARREVHNRYPDKTKQQGGDDAVWDDTNKASSAFTRVLSTHARAYPATVLELKPPLNYLFRLRVRAINVATSRRNAVQYESRGNTLHHSHRARFARRMLSRISQKSAPLTGGGDVSKHAMAYAQTCRQVSPSRAPLQYWHLLWVGQ